MPDQNNYQLGFQSQLEEIDNLDLKLEGELPAWLNGSYIVNGPGQIEFKTAKYNHWFDGLAMLKKFEIRDGKIAYSNRFLRSNDYIQNNAKNTISHTTFGTNSSFKPFYLWEKLLSLTGNMLSDNTSVTVHQFGEDAVAMTELSKIIRFDPNDLSTLGYYDFANKLQMTLSTAHPHFDFKRNKIYNLAVSLGLPSFYIFYEINPKTTRRQVLVKIPTLSVSYAHSFAQTEDYLILSELSMRINPLKLLFTAKPVSHTIDFDAKNPIKFHIIDKNTGEIVKVFESNPAFGFHFANAYQNGNEIILDLIAGKNQEIFKDLTFDKINNPSYFSGKTVTHFERFYLSLADGAVKSEILFPESFEFPIINYTQNSGKKYRYTFGTSQKDLLRVGLIKVDLDNQSLKKWSFDDFYAGEPFFIPNPNSEAEDEGVILSIVLDGAKKQSFLLILDAQNFTEIGRAYVPHVIPFSFHGQFFKNSQTPS